MPDVVHVPLCGAPLPADGVLCLKCFWTAEPSCPICNERQTDGHPHDHGEPNA